MKICYRGVALEVCLLGGVGIFSFGWVLCYLLLFSPTLPTQLGQNYTFYYSLVKSDFCTLCFLEIITNIEREAGICNVDMMTHRALDFMSRFNQVE